MGWEDLLAPDGGTRQVLPWTGGPEVFGGQGRIWRIRGRMPVEHGWFTFDTSGARKAKLVEAAQVNLDFETERKLVQGYLVGDRLIPDTARVDPDPTKLIDQTLPVFIVEPGLDRFARAVVFRQEDGKHIFLRQEFPEGPEMEVEAAYQDRKADLTSIKGVSPSLDLAFRWLSFQRSEAEERAAERERQRIEEERQQAEQARMVELRRNMANPEGRRAMAVQDFDTAARAALQITGSELLDARPGYAQGEMIVQYRFRNRRLECVVDRTTMRVIDAGVCLEDHRTGIKGDTRYTLESLPGVIGEAIDTGRLVVWRHVPGDPGGRYNEDYDGYD